MVLCPSVSLSRLAWGLVRVRAQYTFPGAKLLEADEPSPEQGGSVALTLVEHFLCARVLGQAKGRAVGAIFLRHLSDHVTPRLKTCPSSLVSRSQSKVLVMVTRPSGTLSPVPLSLLSQPCQAGLLPPSSGAWQNNITSMRHPPPSSPSLICVPCPISFLFT